MKREATKRERALVFWAVLLSAVVGLVGVAGPSHAAATPADYAENGNRVSSNLWGTCDRLEGELSPDLREGYERSSAGKAVGSLVAPRRGVGDVLPTSARTPRYSTPQDLMQSLATRAQRKVGGFGPVRGTRKHTYARHALERYQRIFGDRLPAEIRSLQTEVSFLGRTRVPWGTRGSVRLDVWDSINNVTYDYKFVLRPTGRISSRQIQKMQTQGPLGLNIAPPVYP